jgi:hypothetical protein
MLALWSNYNVVNPSSVSHITAIKLCNCFEVLKEISFKPAKMRMGGAGCSQCRKGDMSEKV